MPVHRFRHLDDEEPFLRPEIEALGGQVLGCVREVYRELGAGLREPVYHGALALAFEDAGLPFEHEPRTTPLYKGRPLPHPVIPDFVVARAIVVEVKSVEEFHPTHFLQLMTYLKVTGLPLGYLVNFNVPRLGDGIKRRIRV